MDRIAINGICRRADISEKYKNQEAEIEFNALCPDDKAKYFYSAVFFVGNVDYSEILPWIGNEHLRIAENEESLIEELNFFFGIPEPLEIERKFLVEMPDTEMLNAMPRCSFVEISQAYINRNGIHFRVRKRGRNDNFIYIKTEKIRISEIRRIELESRIDKEEYESCIKGNRVISKTRYLILYKNKYFELDIFPFWRDKALLEIELKNESESFELPDFLHILKEVTNDKNYRNSVLAQKYGVINNE